MFERQLIFLEVVPSIVNPVNKLYSVAYKVQQTFFLLAIKPWISEQHDTSFLLTKYYSYWNVFHLVKKRNSSLVSIWLLGSYGSYSAIAAIIRKPLSRNRSDRSDKSDNDRWARYKRSYLSDRCRCDRWESGFHMIAMITAIAELFFFFSAITAIVATI